MTTAYDEFLRAKVDFEHNRLEAAEKAAAAARELLDGSGVEDDRLHYLSLQVERDAYIALLDALRDYEALS